MESKISLSQAKKVFAYVWFCVGGGIFILVLLQTVFGRLSEEASDVWSWILPMIMPTLSLMAAVIVADSFDSHGKDKMVGRFGYRLTMIISLFYVCSVFCIIVLSSLLNASPMKILNQASLALGPLQGLVTATLGFFFVQKPKARD
jgi:Na+/H+-dicarboxylate symporter